MVEIELKYQVPAAQRDAVRALVAGRGKPARRRVRLQAAYFDTPDRVLARAGLALRLRHEGRLWVQTLKGLGTDGLSREEHNLPLRAADVNPAAALADPRRHAGVPLGERLLALLDGQPPDALQCTYRTDIWRLVRPLRSRHGRVELAFDEGWLLAGAARLPVCELEIELRDGHPMAVLDVARRWALRHGLWLDTRSKAERGDMLSRGVPMAPPRCACAARLQRRQSAHEALQAVIAACRDQVIVNAAQIAAGEFDPEHLHQLRVGLRRLRSGLGLFTGAAGAVALASPLAEPAALLFRRLGAARDAAVIEGELAAALAAAWQEIGAEGDLPLPAADTTGESPVMVLRDAASQGLLLGLIGAGLPPAPMVLPACAPASGMSVQASHAGSAAAGAEPGPALPLRRLLARRLNGWHRAVLQDAAGFEQLDAAARHRLRKRIKRLRYAAEFASGLFDKARVRDSLKPLQRVQDRLGWLNDVTLGLQAFEALKAQDPRAWFALGWLAARRDVLLAGAKPALRALGRAKRFWKR